MRFLIYIILENAAAALPLEPANEFSFVNREGDKLMAGNGLTLSNGSDRRR